MRGEDNQVRVLDALASSLFAILGCTLLTLPISGRSGLRRGLQQAQQNIVTVALFAGLMLIHRGRIAW